MMPWHVVVLLSCRTLCLFITFGIFLVDHFHGADNVNRFDSPVCCCVKPTRV
jgi:hypothetical protein